MSFEQTPVVQILPVTNGEHIIEKTLFGPLFTKETIGRKINWDTTKFKLNRAQLLIDADQDVQSGASFAVTINEQVLQPLIRWEAFDTGNKHKEYELTDLVRGENVYIFTYEVSAYHQQAATMRYQASLKLEFIPLTPGDTTPPVTPGVEEDKDAWSKLYSQLAKNATKIVIVGGLAAVAGSIGYIYYKTSVFGKIVRFARR
jgi:hypothetical protein